MGRLTHFPSCLAFVFPQPGLATVFHDCMKQRSLLLWTVVCVMTGIGAVVFTLVTPPWKVPTVSEEYSLSDSEISRLKHQIHLGDGQAALRLGLFYGLSKNDRVNAEIWFQKSKELGVPEADRWLQSARAGNTGN